MSNLNQIRILVVGDSGVGKTCLIHRICHKKALENPGWTVGFEVNVLCRQYNMGDAESGSCYSLSSESSSLMENESLQYVEFIDISGHEKYKLSRSFIYKDVDGIIFCYDTSNSKSFYNIKRWSEEISKETSGYSEKNVQRRNSHNHNNWRGIDTGITHRKVHSEKTLDSKKYSYKLPSCPIIVIGNKLDLLSPAAREGFKHPHLPAGGLGFNNSNNLEFCVCSSLDPLILSLRVREKLRETLDSFYLRVQTSKQNNLL